MTMIMMMMSVMKDRLTNRFQRVLGY